MSDLDATFAALSDSTRRAILAKLMAGESSLSDLAHPFNMSQTAVSKHVKILGEAGLVTVEKRGRIRHCRLNAAPMRQAVAWINDYQAFWAEQFSNLGQYLIESDE